MPSKRELEEELAVYGEKLEGALSALDEARDVIADLLGVEEEPEEAEPEVVDDIDGDAGE